MQALRSPLIILFTLLGGIDAFLGWRLASSHSDALHAAEHTAEVDDLAGQIERLRVMPLQIEDTVRSGESLAQCAEAAARTAGLDPTRLVHIAPSAPQRLDGMPYMEQRTEIELREVTLRQMSEFCLAIPQHIPGVHIPTLNMRLPPRADFANPESSHETWNVQLTLTSHIYTPNIPPSR